MAATGPRVEVRGAKEFRKAMQVAGADLRDLTRANKEAAKAVLTQAKANAPVLTGRLRNSGKAKATRTKARVQFGSDVVPYAGVIHFGWPDHRISPDPFLYDAADERKSEVIDAYELAIARMVAKVERTTPP